MLDSRKNEIEMWLITFMRFSKKNVARSERDYPFRRVIDFILTI